MALSIALVSHRGGKSCTSDRLVLAQSAGVAFLTGHSRTDTEEGRTKVLWVLKGDASGQMDGQLQGLERSHFAQLSSAKGWGGGAAQAIQLSIGD